MKKQFFILFFLSFVYTISYAQEKEKVFEKVEIISSTNMKNWNDHIIKATQLPEKNCKDIPAGTYKVSVQFIIDVHGNIGQVKAKNDPGFGLVKKQLMQ